MISLRLARVKLFEMSLHGLMRAGNKTQSLQTQAELAAYFFLRKRGSIVVARNWQSGRASGQINIVAWEGDILCFVQVRLQTLHADPMQRSTDFDSRTKQVLRALAQLYLREAGRENAPVRFDLLFVNLKQSVPSKPHRRFRNPRAETGIEYVRGAF